MAIDESPLHVLLSALPYQIYPLLALLTVPLMALIGREYGPMARAQRRFLDEEEDAVEVAPSSARPEAGSATVLAPLCTVMLVLAVLFVGYAVWVGSPPGAWVRQSLLAAYLAGTAVCATLLARQGIFGPGRSLGVFAGGMVPMLRIAAILLLAWSLGDVCESLGTGQTLAALFDRALPVGLLPTLLFVVGALFSLSTGSSWGTFALLLPVAIPVAHQTGIPMPLALAAVLSGGIFGDHCSPVSDTTVLSSMATGCEHAAHVNTQLGYAVVTGCSAFVGFVIAGTTGWMGAIAIAAVLQLVLVVGLMRLLGRTAV